MKIPCTCGHRIYRVHVLKPIEGRQRKHMVHLYRVGAESPDAAISAVLREIKSRPGFITRDWRIVGCSDFSSVGAVILDGVYACGIEEAKKLGLPAELEVSGVSS